MTEHPIPEYRILLTVDIEDYSSRNDAEQRILQSALTGALDFAADAAELNRQEWTRQLSGDGIYAMLPHGTDVTRLMDRFLRELDAGLGAYNRRRDEPSWTPMRLRLAVHAGPVYLDGPMGWPGQHAVQPARLRDSKPVRAALAACPSADLAVIVSAEIYRNYITQGPGDPRPGEFREVLVTEKKQAYAAYLYLPRFDIHSISELDPFAPTSAPTSMPADGTKVETATTSALPSSSAGTTSSTRISAGRDVIGKVSNRASDNGNIQVSGGDMNISQEQQLRRRDQ